MLRTSNSKNYHHKYQQKLTVIINFILSLVDVPSNLETICNPSAQPKYPIPDPKQQTPSLQSPGTSLQTYLYNFDSRRDMLTERAAKRIKSEYKTETISLPFAGTTMDIQTAPQEVQEEKTHRKKRRRHCSSSSSSSEESERNSSNESSSC